MESGMESGMEMKNSGPIVKSDFWLNAFLIFPNFSVNSVYFSEIL
jgi:hypothetical protein